MPEDVATDKWTVVSSAITWPGIGQDLLMTSLYNT